MHTDGTTTCPLCQAVNPRFEAFCRNCGAPIGETATLDPLNLIRSENQLYQKAIEGRPKLIVLIGVWILFSPILLVCLPGSIYLILDHSSSVGFMGFWFGIILSVVAVIMLYRTTKNYFSPARHGKKSVRH
jgi:hypothetical protein